MSLCCSSFRQLPVPEHSELPTTPNTSATRVSCGLLSQQIAKSPVEGGHAVRPSGLSPCYSEFALTISSSAWEYLTDGREENRPASKSATGIAGTDADGAGQLGPVCVNNADEILAVKRRLLVPQRK